MILFTLWSCNGCQNKTYIEQPVYEGTEIEPVSILRFEKELFEVNPDSLESDLRILKQKYGEFYHSYAADILAMPENPNDSLFINSMRMLLGYDPLVQLRNTVDSAYSDLAAEEKQLTQAMGIYKKQFPDEVSPKFVTFISEFGYANITYNNMVGIGLDMYLNERFRDFYIALEFPEFMIRKLKRPYIVPYAVKAFATMKLEDQNTRDKRFIATMLVEGKIRYFTKALLPDVHDTLIMGYTAEQLAWCRNNEPEIWKHFVEKEWIYKNEPSQFIRYFTDGPFTSADGVPAESSPMIGTYIGWQILKHYIKNNPNVSLQDLMSETDFDKILKLSKYRPQ